MPVIQNVNYKEIPGQAKQMRNLGKDLNAEITKAYKSIENMHKSWYGKRYNDLLKSFNSMQSGINDLLDLVVGDIPFALETVANNYSQAETQTNITSASKTPAKKIAKLELKKDSGLKFITKEVEETQNSVQKNFKNAVDKMNEIETTFNKIKWQSEAADVFKQRFKKLKKDIVKSFEDINADLKKLMNQAKQDMQKAESSNTLKQLK